jgi:hypoxanthine-guanine phosphoribosyltransferase
MVIAKISNKDDSSLYQVIDANIDVAKMSTFLFSSAESKFMLFNPYIIGNEFQTCMETIVKKLYDILLQNFSSTDKNEACVLYILRGGLNFAFHKVITHCNAEVSFISCQRVVGPDAQHGLVAEDSYKKINIKNGAALYIGDIAATGITIENILKKIIVYCNENKIKVAILTIVMIGTKQSHDYIVAFIKNNHDVFDKINLIYLEAFFELYHQQNELQGNHLLNTDFFLKEWPRTPEFEIELLNNLSKLTERCAIYDGGSRSFEPSLYSRGLSNYWNKTNELFPDFSLLDYIYMKTDFQLYEGSYDSWLKSRHYFENLTNEEKYGMFELGQKSLKNFENINISNYFCIK